MHSSSKSGESLSARVLITGAAGGIGQAATTALEAAGATVVGLDIAHSSATLRADVCNPEDVKRAADEAVESMGGLDVLLNNAGIGAPQDAGLTPDATARKIVEVNLFGAWTMTAAALPALLQSRGRIVNVASQLALANMPFAAAYCASKRAIAAYSDVLRLEYGRAITVCTVYPSYIKTPIHDSVTQAGISLAGLAREESVEGAAKTLVTAALGRPRRDLATSRKGQLEIALARVFPALTDRVVQRRIQRLIRQGRFVESALAAGLIERGYAQ